MAKPRIYAAWVCLEGAKFACAWPEIRKTFGAIRNYPPPVPITELIHDLAVLIAEKTGFSFHDALIVASALEAACVTLYSEDLQDGQVRAWAGDDSESVRAATG